jgi:hypothetical protein
MYDLWVEEVKTKKAWRVTNEEATRLITEGDPFDYKFYPCCLKDAPKMETENKDFEQMCIEEFLQEVKDGRTNDA